LKSNREFQTQTHYNIELTDEYKSNVQAFNRWIHEEFQIEPTSFYNRKNAWRTIFSNKIIARYLINFFNLFPGYKSDFVDEPELIKNSNLEIRKEFAKGVLMFDGCVTKQKRIVFSSLSQYLAESIRDILIKDGLNTGSSVNKRGEHIVYTTINNPIDKISSYFEKGTKKYDLLMWLDKKNFQSNQISYGQDLLETKTVLELLRKVKICDANFLMGQLDYSHTTVRQHLLILRNRNLIRLSNHPKQLSEYLSDKAAVFLNESFHTYLLNKIQEQFKNFDKFALFMDIPKANLSAWKLKRNRLPLRILKEICMVLEISFNKVLENIQEIDREIAEII
jgi:DNA-binding transcriptional ArsR family regulator